MSDAEPRNLKSETAKREEEIVAFWKKEKIFERSLEKPAPQGEFVFYDGPPFATGLPHHGSLLSSVIKDVIPRYKTMRGYRVPRRWGWDTHGLPIENMVEKKLDLKTKKDIVNIGIDTFNETARSMVLQYVDDWEKYIDRVGRFVDFKNSYKTMDNSFIESVWWALSELNNKKLLYEGRKVLMYCTHCETPLAKAEIAADNTYKDITEEAVTVKFKLKNPVKFGLPENTYVLAWTTTPWTLPGNVGLAVGPEIDYVFVEDGATYLVVAKERLEANIPGREIAGSFKGSQIVGAEYEPLFEVLAVETHKGKKHMVLGADFVTTTDGTGIVHTAVMYGEDDFELGKKEGLPMVQLLSSNGTYNQAAPEFIRGEFIKKAEKIIKENLTERGLLWNKAAHMHSYPHCWRCGTPLIYNAVTSWFINIQKIKQQMLKENEKINWVPSHLKEGRFKHNVENAPDWNISRNRFWASPLPIWKEKKGSELMVVGSLDELLMKTKRSGNAYYVMRHGESVSNTQGVFDSYGNSENHLTEKGKAQALEGAEDLLKKTSIDMIVTSPLLRTRETAEIARRVFNLPESAVMVDERLREMGAGVYDGKSLLEWREYFSNQSEPFFSVPEGAETYTSIRNRVGDFLFEIEKRYPNKKILIVTHECPGWLMSTVARRWTLEETIEDYNDIFYLLNGEVKEMPFVPFPHTKNYELDLHRPYIDEVTLVDEKGRLYERIPEVIDCWVESGSMPFASAGYPRDKSRVNPKRFFGFFPKEYPADFIAEYIAQTRTWFYYMHVMGVALFNRSSFKAVVSTGTILAADGAKMSKSKGNYTDPLMIMDQFGADALRFYLMSSVVMSGEDLNFKDEEVREAHNRVVQMLWNCYKFFELYKAEFAGKVSAAQSSYPLDRWVLSRLSQTVAEITAALDAYDTPSACKSLRSFIDDYSTWYVRRSRDRVKGDDEQDKQYALATQYAVLSSLSRLAAPIVPFVAESIYKGISIEGDPDSVHLTSWPEAGAVDEALIKDMEQIRELASQGLEARERAGIKVRQPLSRLSAKYLPSDLGLRAILAQELNVKEVIENAALQSDVELDVTLTDELKEEGLVRDLVRRVQDWRKSKGFAISDRPSYALEVSESEKEVAEKYRSEIMKDTGLSALTISSS